MDLDVALRQRPKMVKYVSFLSKISRGFIKQSQMETQFLTHIIERKHRFYVWLNRMRNLHQNGPFQQSVLFGI